LQPQRDLRDIEEIQELFETGQETGTLESSEVLDLLQEVDLSTDEIQQVYGLLREHGVEVVDEHLVINGAPFDESAYELEPFDGIQDGEPGWPYWRITALSGTFPDRTTVSARWGWETVPDSVIEGVLMLAAEVFKMKDAPFGVAGWNEILGQITVRDNPKVKSLLAPYRRGAVRVA
jgi:hypothetical protein